MSKIRILVVIESAAVRKAVADLVSEDPTMEIVGSYATGRMAMLKIPPLDPHVVLLDPSITTLDGPSPLRQIRKSWPRLPVILFGKTADGDNFLPFDPEPRPTDVVNAPTNLEGFREIREELLLKLRLHGGHGIRPDHPILETLGSPATRTGALVHRVDAVAIGISTGGPNALHEMLPGLSADFPVPVFIVQHMPALFTKLLAERLDAKTKVKVVEAADDMPIQPGVVYIAPGNRHMVVERGMRGIVIRTNQDPPENSCRPAVDVLFRSLPAVYGSRLLAVLMTGMGQDGLKGCEVVRQGGGRILAQNEESSTVWGMPGVVVRAGLADAVVPLNRLAAEITSRVESSRSRRQ